MADDILTFTLPSWLTAAHLHGLQRGIEKEGLRMADDGFSAKTAHPKALGSKLTHPYITTDYSENLLELITPPYCSIDAALAMLTKLHIWVQQSLENNEIVWPLSMPCMLSSSDVDIPLADYGTSNIGKLKTLYRSGLGVRYGRKMQTIAGLHYNFSIGDDLFLAWHQSLNTSQEFDAFKNAKYLALIRNFKRLSPMVLYLTGASPSVCACFVKDKTHDLIPLNDQKNSYYLPNATSLRMGKLGYTNSVQQNLDIRYNSLDEYTEKLQQATRTPFAAFSQLGVDDTNNNPIQINDHILQIENEFYSPIRPKQITQSGQTPSNALKERGIAYVEFRAIDLDPYEPIGISKNTACFLEILALYCLFCPSPDLLPDEEAIIAQNIQTIVNDGRNPNATITLGDTAVPFVSWLLTHLEAMRPLAALFDQQTNNSDYSRALDTMHALAQNSQLTPSARLIKDSQAQGSTWLVGKTLGQQHRQTLLAQPLSQDEQDTFVQLSQISWQEQKQLEESDTLSFAEFLAPYRQSNTH